MTPTARENVELPNAMSLKRAQPPEEPASDGAKICHPVDV